MGGTAGIFNEKAGKICGKTCADTCDGTAYVPKRRAAPFTSIHSTIPAAVGNRNATVVQNRLFVSRRMVISVVAQGKWQRENNAAHAAVTHVQPFAARIPPVCAMPSASTSMPL